MRVSQRLDYALRTLVEVARAGGAPVAVGELADAMGLPRRFVEQQMTTLAKHGVVVSKRGSGGGCVLARSASQTTVGEVVRAIQGTILDVPHTSGSAVAEMWDRAAETLERRLDSETIAELVARQEILMRDSSAMYFI
ncbi:MAG: Rrf2 family transcriptional regulator [Coriobacteriia bacterium]|nr:Rrf2 family transcriptional regulator [Coriobacteriia bacterium]